MMTVDPTHEYWTPHNGRTGMVAFTVNTGERTTVNSSGETYPLEFRVSVDAVDEEHRTQRDAFVAALRRAVVDHNDVRDAERRAADAADRAKRSDIARRAADGRVEAILGRAPSGRLFGPCEVRPHHGGDWAGPVWLLDPVKRFSGFGFQFPTLGVAVALPPVPPAGRRRPGRRRAVDAGRPVPHHGFANPERESLKSGSSHGETPEPVSDTARTR